jgi:hypothetical protein
MYTRTIPEHFSWGVLVGGKVGAVGEAVGTGFGVGFNVAFVDAALDAAFVAAFGAAAAAGALDAVGDTPPLSSISRRRRSLISMVEFATQHNSA